MRTLIYLYLTLACSHHFGLLDASDSKGHVTASDRYAMTQIHTVLLQRSTFVDQHI